MKKVCFSLLIIALVFNNCRAQYITIPDTGFASWLHENGYDSCMVGNQLDTLCSRSFEYPSDSLNLSNRNISDLTGIHYISWANPYNFNDPFKYIDLSHNNFTSFPVQLYERFNGYFSVNLDYNYVNAFVMDGNYIGLNELSMAHNGLNSFTLGCCNGDADLGYLDVSYNNLTTFPATTTPGNAGLIIRHNYLTSAPPAGDFGLINCGANQITSFSGTDYDWVTGLIIDSNLVTSLDLSLLGTYWGVVYLLDCSHNQLTSITNLQFPSMGGGSFLCNDNNLTSIPHYPTDAGELDCHNNPLLQCIPNLPNVSSFQLNYSNTSVQCLPRLYPNCVYNSIPAIDSVPTCDLYNNVYDCPQYSNFEGYVYISDTSLHCVMDSTERKIEYIKAEVLQNGNVQQQIYSDWTGHYSFDEINYGTYTLQIDTTYIPIAVQCPDSNFYSAIVDSAELYQSGFNFGMNCKAGFDIGCGGLAWSAFFPNTNCTVSASVGDMSAQYGLHCASGISGQVQIVYNGPLTFLGMNPGATVPSTISNDTIIWNIADFGALGMADFSMLFYTDSTAQNGEGVCFDVNVTPVIGDNVPSNNNFSWCDIVHTSYDPNAKFVSPSGYIDTSQKWLTYTIHFQNTGNATAKNILITDTLSPNLDPTSFQLLNYSHNNVTQISQTGIVDFNFPSINLPDSGADQEGSRGYIQYNIRLKDNLPYGTQIYNTANIYFDFNTPVVTNTTFDMLRSSSCQTITIDTSVNIFCGDSIIVGSMVYDTSGNYTDTLVGSLGCDSIVNLHLAILIDTAFIYDTICHGSSLAFNGGFIDTAGTYLGHFIAQNGCDSFVVLQLAVSLPPVVSLSWDSLVEEEVLGGNDFDAFWCTGEHGILPLAGGIPTGGIYTGAGISGNAIYVDSFGYNIFGGILDTITYTLTLNNCSASATDILRMGGCEGINEINSDNLFILYPNPAKNYVIVETSADAIGSTLQITDVTGREIARLQLITANFKLQTSNFSSGVYFIKLFGNQGQNTTRKLVIE